MSRRSTLATKADGKKCLQAVLDAGVTPERIAGVEFKPDGGIVVRFGRPEDQEASAPANYWDKVFKK